MNETDCFRERKVMWFELPAANEGVSECKRQLKDKAGPAAEEIGCSEEEAQGS